MTRCPTCQHDNADGAPFCAECGTRLNRPLVMAGPATGTLPYQTVLQDRYVVMQKLGQAKDTQAFGTIGYSAPEQYGKGQTDARSDVYSLGVLLHQLLTGYDPTLTPFRLPPASQVNPNVSRPISDAIAAATDSDPGRRFMSMRAFRDALFNAAAGAQPFVPAQLGGAVYARPDSRPYALQVSPPYDPPLSQPYDHSRSQPFGTADAPPNPLSLANISRWVGIASVAIMGLATLIVGGAAAAGDTGSTLAGFGYVLAFLPLISGPVGLLIGIVALVNSKTAQALNGKRSAVVGIATGIATLLLCCAIGVMAGSFNNVER
jgi:serine/threonine-protein kinase